MGTFNTVKRVASGSLVAVALLAFLVFPGLAGAEDGWIEGTISATYPAPLGDPLSGATVSVQNTSFSTTTDAEGKYRLSVPPGNYTLKVSATNYVDKTSGTVRVTASETATYDTFLEKLKGSLSGRITDYDDSTPLQYVMVTPEGWLLGEITDADGRYSFDSIAVGIYKMNVTPLPPHTGSNFSVTIKPGQNVVKDIRLKAISMVIFTVKDSDNKPVLGATVSVGNYSTTTDVDGLAKLEVVPSHYVMKIQADGYKTVIQDDTVGKGDIKAYSVTLVKASAGGGGGGIPIAVIAGAAGAVIIAVVAVVMVRRRKAPAVGPAGATGGPAAAGGLPGPGAPPGEKTQAQKMKEWADFERMYGRPHPEAPGWVSAGAAAASAPKPKCPRDRTAVTYEPFSGKYFCSKCDERYSAEEVFRKEDELLKQERPAEAPVRQAGSEEPERPAAGEKLEISAAQPTWALEHGQTMDGEAYVAPGAAAPQGAAPAAAPEPAPTPPAAAPMEAAPVSDDEHAAEAAPATTPEGVNPEAGPLFTMPKPVDYSELPPPPPPKEPPKPPE